MAKHKMKFKKVSEGYWQWYMKSWNMNENHGFCNIMSIPIVNIIIGFIITITFPFMLLGYLFRHRVDIYEEV